MKIVINSCYGGYSLSPVAVKRLAEKKGRPSYFFSYIDPETGKVNLQRHFPTTAEAAQSAGFTWSAYDIPNPEILDLKEGANWREMPESEKREHNKRYESHSLTSRPEDRTDKDLIAVIEELGKEASGHCAELKIVEIPDDVEWEIAEYDGYEHVAEQHRTWG